MTLILLRPTPFLNGNKNTIRLEEDRENVLVGKIKLALCVQRDAEPVSNAQITLTRYYDNEGNRLDEPKNEFSVTNEKGLAGFKLSFSLVNSLEKQYVNITHGSEVRTLWFAPPDPISRAVPPRKPKIIISDDDLPVPVGPSPRLAAVPPPIPLFTKPPKPPEPPSLPEPDSDGVPQQPMPEPNNTEPQLSPEEELYQRHQAILAEIEQAFQAASKRFDTHTTDETVAALEQITKEAEHAIAALHIEAGILSRVIAPEPPVPEVAAVPPVRTRKRNPRFQLTGSAAQMTIVLAVMLLAVSLIFLR